MSSLSRLVLASAVGVVLGACDAPELSTPDAAGRTARLFFDGGLFGEPQVQRVPIRNDGTGAARLEFGALTGDVGLAPGLASFTVSLEPPGPLEPGRTQSIVAEFRPRPVEGEAEPARYAGTVQLGDPRVAGQVLTLELEGTATPNDCEVPRTVDFGLVRRGGFREAFLAVRNATSFPVQVGRQAVEGPQEAAFLWLDGSDDVEAPPLGLARLKLSFFPSAVGRYEATVRVRAARGCGWRTVRLRGEAVEAFLAVEPAQVDCGFVNREAPRAVPFVVHNLSTRDVSLREGVGDPRFSLAPAFSGSFTVPALGQRTVELLCAPRQVGLASAVFRLETSLDLQREVTFPVRAVGGIPRLIPGAPALIFDEPDEVKLVDGLLPSQERLSLVLNHAEPPAVMDRPVPELDVRLARTDDAGQPLPFHEILPGPGTAPEDFVLLLPGGGAPGPIAAGRAGVLTVQATATSPGQREATLVLYTTAAASPRLEVKLFSEARGYGSCRLGLPDLWDLGMVQPGWTATRDNPIVNVGTLARDVCFLGELQGRPPFRFGARPLDRIGPGAAVPIPLVLQGDFVGPGEYQDRLRLSVSSATQPTVELPVKGAIGQGCLSAAPLGRALPVPEGCLWHGTVSVTNECDTPLQYGPLTLEPFCSGQVAACGPYELVSPTPLSGGTLAPGGSFPLALRYTGFPGGSVSVFTTLGDGGLRGLGLATLDTGDRRAPLRPLTPRALVVVSASQRAQPAAVYRAVVDALEGAADAGVPFLVSVVRGEWDQGQAAPGTPLPDGGQALPDGSVPGPDAREPMGWPVAGADGQRTVFMGQPDAGERLLERLLLASSSGGPGRNRTDVCLEAARLAGEHQVVLCLTGDGDTSSPRRAAYDEPAAAFERAYYAQRLRKQSVSAVVGACGADAGQDTGLESLIQATHGVRVWACQPAAALEAQLAPVFTAWRLRAPLSGYGPSQSSLIRVEEERPRVDGGVDYFDVGGWRYWPGIHALEVASWQADGGGRLVVSHSLSCPP